MGTDKGTASTSSSSFWDLANGVHLLGSSWNNKLYHPKKQNHKRGSACSPAHKSPLSGGPRCPPISQRKLNLTKINSTPSPALSRSPQQTMELRGLNLILWLANSIAWLTPRLGHPRRPRLFGCAVPRSDGELLTSPSQVLQLPSKNVPLKAGRLLEVSGHGADPLLHPGGPPAHPALLQTPSSAPSRSAANMRKERAAPAPAGLAQEQGKASHGLPHSRMKDEV